LLETFMVRIFILVAVVLVVSLAGWFLFRRASRATIDWTGVAMALGFVGLAFYLRHATGMG